MVDFPAGDPDIPTAALTGETLATMHAGVGHPAATNRLTANIKALAAKLGYGASLPGAVAGLLRRTASGQSAWGQALAGDYGPASIAAADIANDVITAAQLAPNAVTASELADGAVTRFAQLADGVVQPAKIQHLGAGNVLKSNGTTNVAGKIVSADIQDAAIAGTDLANQTIHGSWAGAGTGQILAGSINGARDIQDGSITGADIATGAISTDQVGYGAAGIHGNRIVPLTVYGGVGGAGAQIAPGTINKGDLAAGAVAQIGNSVPDANTFTLTGTPQVLNGGTITLTTTAGSYVVVQFVGMPYVSGGTATMYLDVVGATVAGSNALGPVATQRQVALIMIFLPNAGANTFRIKAAGSGIWDSGTGQVVPTFIATEFKKPGA